MSRLYPVVWFVWLFPAMTMTVSLVLLATGKSRSRVLHHVVFCALIFAGTLAMWRVPWPYPMVVAGVTIAAIIGWTTFGYRIRIYDR